jgi:hypothetical protein
LNPDHDLQLPTSVGFHTAKLFYQDVVFKL